MRPIKSMYRYVLLITAALLVGACTSQMEPAKQALADAQSAIDAASADASKYEPDELNALRTRLASLKGSFDTHDYAAVLANAPGVSGEARTLSQEAAAKKEEAMKALNAQWMDLASSVPKLMESANARAAALSKAKHVPKGVALAPAKADLADASHSWEKAQAAQAAGNVEEAVKAGQAAKAKVAAAADDLKTPGNDHPVAGLKQKQHG